MQVKERLSQSLAITRETNGQGKKKRLEEWVTIPISQRRGVYLRLFMELEGSVSL
jgi:hypothetical protein